MTCSNSSTTASAGAPHSSPVSSRLDHWHDYIGDPTLADAILDRLLHNAHKIHLEGKESMRKRDAAADPKTTVKTKEKLTERDRPV